MCKSKTAHLSSRWECRAWEGHSGSQLGGGNCHPWGPWFMSMLMCVLFPARLFAPWGQGSYLVHFNVTYPALAVSRLVINVWWMTLFGFLLALLIGLKNKSQRKCVSFPSLLSSHSFVYLKLAFFSLSWMAIRCLIVSAGLIAWRISL